MNYSAIRTCDVANGPGVRVSLFVSGCTHHCPGCFNESTWDFASGSPWTPVVAESVLAACAPEHIQGLSLLGGEPFEPENQTVLAPFAEEFKKRFPKKDLWCWTGCLYERDLLGVSRWHTVDTTMLLRAIDVLVDGPFIEAKKDISLVFRGSSNQRIIRLR